MAVEGSVSGSAPGGAADREAVEREGARSVRGADTVLEAGPASEGEANPRDVAGRRVERCDVGCTRLAVPVTPLGGRIDLSSQRVRAVSEGSERHVGPPVVRVSERATSGLEEEPHIGLAPA